MNFEKKMKLGGSKDTGTRNMENRTSQELNKQKKVGTMVKRRSAEIFSNMEMPGSPPQEGVQVSSWSDAQTTLNASQCREQQLYIEPLPDV